MNKNAIKKFAIWARITLINAVSQVAYEYEVTNGGKNDPAQTTVNGVTLTETEKIQRSQLITKINSKGFSHTMEEAAYTWFNRFIALRFMEVNNYLPSHMRIFSNEDGEFKPEVLNNALDLEIEGLDKNLILEMLENQENERLYKYIIITQCNALNEGLPEMFEKIGGWTELLFPKNLLREDSIISHMINDIPEDDWKDQVQIIGWLYQYYNSEPKDKVFADMKKNIKISAEAIPAATQLFTPDWIVRYMVENSLGRLWADGHGKPANSNWKYYLDEAEQEESVKIQLEKIREEYRNIKPEDIKFLDPCMGSGHILVYAFDVLMEIYSSCGWTERDAAKSILKNNLYGLDIDSRAYQLAYFSVMMKARQYNRRILSAENQPNLANFADIAGLNTSTLQGDLKEFVDQFADADIYGSLMEATAPEGIDEAISKYPPIFGLDRRQMNMMAEICKILSQKYDVVCTNPPYMGGSGMNSKLSAFVKKNYPDSKSDLFAVFIERCGNILKKDRFQAMITQHSWMFLSSFEKLRTKILQRTTVNMAHLGARAFEEIGGEVVQTTSFVILNGYIKGYKGTYCRLISPTTQDGKEQMFLSGENRFATSQLNFSKIPGSPVAYWVGERFVKAFENPRLGEISRARSGVKTGKNEIFVHNWWEIDNNRLFITCPNYDECAKSTYKWFPYNKGGEGRNWYGNRDLIVDFEKGGKNIADYSKKHGTSIDLNAKDVYFKKGITWTALTSSRNTFRFSPIGSAFDSNKGPLIADKNDGNIFYLLGFLNTKVTYCIIKVLNPSLSLQNKDVDNIPIIIDNNQKPHIDSLVTENISLSKQDWDSYETSWDFEKSPLV